MMSAERRTTDNGQQGRELEWEQLLAMVASHRTPGETDFMPMDNPTT